MIAKPISCVAEYWTLEWTFAIYIPHHRVSIHLVTWVKSRA